MTTASLALGIALAALAVGLFVLGLWLAFARAAQRASQSTIADITTFPIDSRDTIDGETAGRTPQGAGRACAPAGAP